MLREAISENSYGKSRKIEKILGIGSTEDVAAVIGLKGEESFRYHLRTLLSGLTCNAKLKVLFEVEDKYCIAVWKLDYVQKNWLTHFDTVLDF